jgi:uncharacterized membrane protein
MATLTVLKFGNPDGAKQGLELVQNLQKQSLITLEDAAIVTWPAGSGKPRTQHLVNLPGLGALDGAFWGMLFGFIFFVPLLGMAIGALTGALAAHFADYGINDQFINDVRSKVTEGTSALFLLTSDAVMDRVTEAMKSLPHFEIIATNLPKEQEAQLRAAFSPQA